MNELPKSIEKGTFGEVLVQLRFLQHSVQAASPIKDTGNDLIAIRRDCFRAVQVKTTAGGFPVTFSLDDLPERYHILALVLLTDLRYDNLRDFNVSLDKARIFLLDREQVKKGYWTEIELSEYEFGKARIDQLFPWTIELPNHVLHRIGGSMTVFPDS